MSKRETDLYLADIIESAKKIGKYIRSLTLADFKKDSRTQDAVVRNLEVIGEAAYNLPKEFKKEYQEIPWTDISDMRNKLVHEYFGIDSEIVWKTICEDLPLLIKKIAEIKNTKI